MKNKIAELSTRLGMDLSDFLELVEGIRLCLNEPVIISGNGCQSVAKEVSESLGFRIINTKIAKFPNGEPDVSINESVRGTICFFIQTFRTGQSDQDLSDLEAVADAFKRASGKEIHLVSLIFPGQRQDRRESDQKRSRPTRRPITAKINADKFEKLFDSVITVHLHSEQIEGFFSKIPIENLNVSKLFKKEFEKMGLLKKDSFVLVAPDVGGTKYVSDFAHSLHGCEYAIIDKRRSGPGQTEAKKLIGEVRGKTAIILDDQLDTGGTLCTAARFLIENGATEVFVGCTHFVGSGGTEKVIKKMIDSDIKKILVTDTIPTPELEKYEIFKVLKISPIIVSVISAHLTNASLENATSEVKQIAST
jgi:ribose-phosphate pyrophosphokinase